MKGLAFPKPKGSIFFKSSFSRGFSLQTTKNLRFFHQEKKPQSKQSQNSNLEPRKAKKKLTSEQLLKTCLHTKDQKKLLCVLPLFCQYDVVYNTLCLKCIQFYMERCSRLTEAVEAVEAAKAESEAVVPTTVECC